MSNIFLVKGWEQQAYHQIEKTKPIYRIDPFQNRKPTIKIDIMEKDGFMCNLDFRDVYFLHSVARGPKEICVVLLARQSLLVLLSGTSTFYF